MSAFLQSGRFYPGETPIFRVRFRLKSGRFDNEYLPSYRLLASMPGHRKLLD